MRITKVFVVFGIALMMFAVLPCQAAEKEVVTATDIGDPFGVLGKGPIGYFDISHTTIVCPGHEPTNNPSQPCPPGSATHYRQLVIGGIPLTSGDPRFNGGVETVAMNINYNENGEGPFWGNWRINLMDGGVLEGTSIGQYVNGGSAVLSKGELHGTGGSVDGLTIKVDGQGSHLFGGAVFVDSYVFTIIDPHEKKE